MAGSFFNEMAASRFVNVSDEDISQFLEENENKNTQLDLQEHFKRTIRLTFPSFFGMYLHSYTIIECNFLVLQLGGLIFFKHVICNKQIITC